MSQGSARIESAQRSDKTLGAAASDGAAKCSRCGGRLSGAGLGGTCPRCLLACAITDMPDLEPEGSAGPSLLGAGEPLGGERTGHARTAGERTDPTTGRLPPRFGRYTLVRRLGSGAMGEVYLAFDSQMNRQVAVKTPHFERTADPTAIERFRREARLAAALSHPNICPVYDVGEVDGVLYYTMAYINGVPLTRWIEDPRPMSVTSVVELVLRMALAMAQAHRQKIVHRDLKPANVMIDRRGEPIIMDFGLARHATIDGRLTQSNAVVGTPAYLAPELISGESDSPATDVYALGVILFEMLTKRLPFSGPLGELLAQITRDPPPAPSRFHAGVPQRLDAICLKALAKDPVDRFATMDDFAAELTRFLRRSPSSIVQLWLAPARRRFGHTRGTRFAIGGLAVVVSALLAVLAGVLIRDHLATNGSVEVAESSSGQGEAEKSGNKRTIATSQAHADGQTGALAPDAGTAGSPTGPTSTNSPNAPTVHVARPGVAEPGIAEPGVEPRIEPGAKPAAAPRADVPAGQRTIVNAKPNLAARGAATTPAPLLVERNRLTDESTSQDKPTDVPKSSASIAEQTLAEIRRINARRRELVGRIKAVNERMTHEIPEAKLKLTGDLAGSRRLGEEAVFELQQIDNRIAQLTLQRNVSSGGGRNTLDQELRLLAQNRERVSQRARGLDAEIRGKTVEMGLIDRNAAQLQQQSQQLIAESAQLVDAAFWNADPAGSLERKIYQSVANEYSEWLRDSGSPPELLALRAIALANAGQADDAFRDAQRALTQQPKSALVLSAMGYVKFVRGQTADAIADYNRALRFTPQSPHALFFRGLANRRRGSQSAALEDFATALKGAPDAPWAQAHWALQQVIVTDGNLAKAAIDWPRAVDVARQACDATGRQSWFCLDALAATLAATEQWADAVATEEAAVILATPEFRPTCAGRLEAYRARRRATF